MEKRDVIAAAKAVVTEFEAAADRWSEHFLSHTMSELGHKNLELYLMAKEVVRLRQELAK